METETNAAIVRSLYRSQHDPRSAERDALLDALSHRYRRFVVAALEDSGQPLALADLAADVAARDTAESPTIERIRTIKIELYHVHVPKLAETGLVAFDRDRNVVRSTEQSER